MRAMQTKPADNPRFPQKMGVCFARKCLCAGILVLSLYAACAGAAETPAVQKPNEFDLGVVGADQAVTHEFTLRNPTAKKMIVAKVTPSCGCVTVLSAPGEVKPHSSAVLKISFQGHKAGSVSVDVAVEFKTGEPVLYHMAGSVTQYAAVNAADRAAYEISRAEFEKLDGASRLIVDVRDPQKYSMAHIEGALNLALYFVGTHKDWKEKHLVLVDEGFNGAALILEGKKLAAQGFQHMHVLKGGMRLWQMSGGKIAGPIPDSPAISEISPLEFAGSEPGWITLDYKAPGASGPGKGGKEDASLVKTIKQRIAQAPDTKVLVISADGQGYGSIEPSVPGLGAPLFYMKGGKSALDAYRAMGAAAQNPQKVTIVNSTVAGTPGNLGLLKHKNGCGSCP
jgi:rhodanese-related sulfurtransferase